MTNKTILTKEQYDEISELQSLKDSYFDLVYLKNRLFKFETQKSIIVTMDDFIGYAVNIVSRLLQEEREKRIQDIARIYRELNKNDK